MQEKEFKNAVCKMTAILSVPQWVNKYFLTLVSRNIIVAV